MAAKMFQEFSIKKTMKRDVMMNDLNSGLLLDKGSFHLKTVQNFKFCNPPSQNLLIFGTHEHIHEI